MERGDGALVRGLKAIDQRLPGWSFRNGRLLLGVAALGVATAAASVPFFPRTFLPAFNEGTLTINVLLDPGSSLAESNRVGTLAEALIRQVPEVIKTGRRTGRAELDEHAEGVHYSEIDVDTLRSLAEELRQRLGRVPGLVDLQVEKQVRIPQAQVRVDYARAAAFGITPAAVNDALATLVGGKEVAQIIEDNRRVQGMQPAPGAAPAETGGSHHHGH